MMKRWYLKLVVVPVLKFIMNSITDRMDQLGQDIDNPDNLFRITELSRIRSMIANMIRDIQSSGYRKMIR